MRVKDPLLWVALLATAGSLWLGFELKEECGDWMCYTDITVLYYDEGPRAGEGLPRGIHEGRTPYVEGFNEYPVLTGLYMHVTGVITRATTEPDAEDPDAGNTMRQAYLRVNAVGLAIAALASTFVLWQLAGDRRRVFWFALAPSLVLYAFHNWDLLAVLLVVTGLWAHRRGRPLAAGVLLGMGAAAKIWPGLLLPMVGLELLRDEGLRLDALRSRARDWVRVLGPRAWRFGLGGVGAVALPNLPFFLLNRDLFLETYRFHAERGPTVESFWHTARVYADRWDLASLQPLLEDDPLTIGTRVLLLAGMCALGWAVWTRRLGSVEASFATVLWFLVTNQVFSVQYALWVVPFFVLLPVPWERLALFFVADAAVYRAIFGYFTYWRTEEGHQWFEWLAAATTLRHVVLLLLIAWVVKLGWDRHRAAQGPAEDPAVAAPGP